MVLALLTIMVVLAQLSKSITKVTSTHNYQFGRLEQISILDRLGVINKVDSYGKTVHVSHQVHVLSQLPVV